jgi:4-amino-4-deoxy-L-arabinose transferase-like glycosyltransferase
VEPGESRRRWALWVLAGLLLAGAGLRIVAAASWWPVATTLADAAPYTYYAEHNPLANPQHPAGYPVLLWFLALVSQEVALAISVQHLLGLVTAVVLWAGVRRVAGSPWPGLVPAAVVLLNLDGVFLEHQIMSEGPFMAVLASATYAATRSFDLRQPWWLWPVAAGALVGLATMIRPAALFAIPVVALAILLARQGNRRAAGVALATASVLLLAYSGANAISNGRFEIAPAQGWHLYGRVASFADCEQFTPPKATRALCETTPPAQRPGGNYYLYFHESPAIKLWGARPYEHHDGDLRAFAVRVILHQPRTYAAEMWRDLRSYFFPGSVTPRTHTGGDLHPIHDWKSAGADTGEIIAVTEEWMEKFYADFEVRKSTGGIAFLGDLQRVLSFGATLLVACTVLTLAGLLVGRRRMRAGVLLFGIGGLALLVAPVLSVFYVGRYVIPMAPFAAAGAAIAGWAILGEVLARRRPVAPPSRGRAR